MDIDLEPPLKSTEPIDGESVYPLKDPIVYEYDPSYSLNIMVFDVEYCVFPFNVTCHDVPEDNPDSVNITLYFCGVGVGPGEGPGPILGPPIILYGL